MELMSTPQETPLISTVVMVKELKQGDIFEGHWTALADAANLHDHYCSVQVQYVDGGVGEREWQDPTHQLRVLRPGSTPA